VEIAGPKQISSNHCISVWMCLKGILCFTS